MMTGKRTLYSAVLLLCSGLYLPLGHALSLGNVEIESFLNQKLSFSIPVNKSSSERWQAGDVLVSLADSDAYHQLGLAYPWALGDITLQVEDGAEGQLLIRGRSKKVVRELLVALLVRVEWPKGSIQKEYTALIDVNGVTNVAPTPPLVNTGPAPIQLLVKNGSVEQSVVVQPFSGEATAIEVKPATDEIERVEVFESQGVVEDEVAGAEVAVEVVNTGYPSQDPVYLYKVARGDILSLLAQRFRGSIELPLHQYIHSINNENLELYPEGMAELSIGQLIRIPNPERVAAAYTYTKRQLVNPNENVSHHRYQVRYGDSLFLIAQAFKPAGTDTESFMQTLLADNPAELSSANQALRPRVALRIANADYVEARPAVAPKIALEPEIIADQPESIAQVEKTADVSPVLPVVDGSAPSDEIYFPAPLVADDEFLFSEGSVAVAGRRSVTPRLKANLRAIEQYVGSDEKNLVYEVIQTNNRLPLLYEQVIRLNQQISSLQLDMAELQVDNKQLNKQLEVLQQQQIDHGASRSLQWFLLVLVFVLLLACLAMYLYIRRLARGLDFKASPSPLAEPIAPVEEQTAAVVEKTRSPRVRAARLKDRLVTRPKKVVDLPVVVGEQDYSKYDISKSNYDYSQAYDVGALEQKIKSGENAFEHTPATIEFETYTENLITVKRLIKSEEFVAAEILLDKLLAADSSQFDNWLARLELQLKTHKQQEADALYAQLQQMFVETEQLAALENIMHPAQAMSQEECAKASIPQAANYPAPDADKLYEARVYLSYSHLDMAELSINSLLKVNPLFPETLLLKLEYLAAQGQQVAFRQLQQELGQRRGELSDMELSALDKLAQETEFTDSADETVTVFDDSTQLLSEFDVEDDEASAELTAIIDEGFDLDELEELDDDVVIEAETDDEKEFLAAIQEQMDSYTREDEAKSEENSSVSSEIPMIPDDVRIPD